VERLLLYCFDMLKMTVDSIVIFNGSILGLHASIVSVNGPTLVHFEPPQLLYFDFDADPAFHSEDPTSKTEADSDPDPPHWLVDFQTFSE
jgi:hypothetical protein